MTLIEVILSSVLFLILLTAVFSLLTQSVKLLEPSSKDELSEVLLLAAKLRSDVRTCSAVTVVDDSLVLTGDREGVAFTVTYSEIEKAVFRDCTEPELGASSSFFMNKDDVRFEYEEDLITVDIDIKIGERDQTLQIKAAGPVEP